jgi:penicillin-binding protein 1C
VLLGRLLIADQLLPPLPGRDAGQALLIVARDGTPLRAFPDRNHVWRHPVALDEVAPPTTKPCCATKTAIFAGTRGQSLRARARRRPVGHQRPHRLGRLDDHHAGRPHPRAHAAQPGRQARQILRALQLEARLSKDEILTLYLNHAPMGGVLEGVEAASRAYLGKPARRLSHAEAALLVVLPQAPSLLRPDRHPAAARAARDKVLQRMRGTWRDADIADALQEPAYAQTLREPLLAPCSPNASREPPPAGAHRHHPRRAGPAERRAAAGRPPRRAAGRVSMAAWWWTTPASRCAPTPARPTSATPSASATWTWCGPPARPARRSSPFSTAWPSTKA